MVKRSIITLALLHEFVYEFRGNNTYIILDRTALGALQKNALESMYSKILESESKSVLLKFIVKVEKSLSVDCCFMDRERYKCGGSTSNSLERLFSRAIKTIREVVSTTSQLLQLSLALFSHSKLYTIE